MSDVAFLVHLGGGLYLDSKGDLHTGPAPRLPVYELGFNLPIDPKKVQQSLNDFKQSVEKALADPVFKKTLEILGFKTKIFGLLSAVAKIAGFVAPVFFVASLVIDLLQFFGFLKTGPDRLELLMQQRFDELQRDVHAIGEQIQIKDLRSARVSVELFSARIKDYVAKLNNLNPDPAALEADLRELRTAYDVAVNQFAILFDPDTWLTSFSRAEHTRVWPWIERVLFTEPGTPGASSVPAMRPLDGDIRFDHRLMVPLTLYAAETYLACIRGIVPEYRTVGDFRTTLKDFSRHLQTLAEEMRQFVLARTIYQPAHFHLTGFTGIPEVLDDPFGVTPEHLLTIAPTCSRWSVGALDLREHGDAFFGGFLDDMWRSEFLGFPHATKHGSMNFRWIPPAKLRRAGVDLDGHRVYQITNPDECSAAANEQSEKDYADLLVSSGYIELVQVATLLRHESTEPNKSQTVATEPPILHRRPLASAQVTVESSPRGLFLPAHITAVATREPQDCSATVHITTQSTKRAQPIRYRIKLRTLDSIVSGSWREPSYDEYQWAQYEADLADPGFLRLVLYTSNMALNDPNLHLLVEGSSPRDTIHKQGSVTMRAHTFDWWIPTRPPYSLEAPFSSVEHQLHGLGWNRHSLDEAPLGSDRKVPTGSNPGSASAGSAASGLDVYIPGISWKGGAQNWDGEHREPRVAEATMNYELTWEADRLTIELTNRPSDRNYVVYVVVEEFLVTSGQWLHTAVPVPMNGQLTYVPQRFFDEERKAIEDGKRKMSEFLGKYSEVSDFGPLDPIVGWVRPGDLATTAGVERILQLAEKHQPGLLRSIRVGGNRVE